MGRAARAARRRGRVAAVHRTASRSTRRRCAPRSQRGAAPPIGSCSRRGAASKRSPRCAAGAARAAPRRRRRRGDGRSSARRARPRRSRRRAARPPGWRPTLVATATRCASRDVLLALAENAGDVLERTLHAAGAGARARRLPHGAGAAGRRGARCRRSRADNVVLASPSAVTGFVHQVDVDVPVSDLHDRPVDDGGGARARARRDGRSARAELGRNLGGHAMAELIDHDTGPHAPAAAAPHARAAQSRRRDAASAPSS